LIVENKSNEIDTDCDLIVLHMFSNDVRNVDPEKCGKVHDDLISKLQRQCQFAKIVISLPFHTRWSHHSASAQHTEIRSDFHRLKKTEVQNGLMSQ
jgi:RNase H-fold protein (predicted Holliday junction resolvase)